MWLGASVACYVPFREPCLPAFVPVCPPRGFIVPQHVSVDVLAEELACVPVVCPGRITVPGSLAISIRAEPAAPRSASRNELSRTQIESARQTCPSPQYWHVSTEHLT